MSRPREPRRRQRHGFLLADMGEIATVALLGDPHTVDRSTCPVCGRPVYLVSNGRPGHGVYADSFGGVAAEAAGCASFKAHRCPAEARYRRG